MVELMILLFQSKPMKCDCIFLITTSQMNVYYLLRLPSVIDTQLKNQDQRLVVSV